jgi:truncated hemoglobin YjbI
MVRMSTPVEPHTFYGRGRSRELRCTRARFNVGVAADPELRALCPEEDLVDAEEPLRMFLEQYWGAPTTYGQLRGHPGLRMRRLSQGMNAVRWDSVKGAWATTTLREPAPKGLTAGKIRQPSRDGQPRSPAASVAGHWSTVRRADSSQDQVRGPCRAYGVGRPQTRLNGRRERSAGSNFVYLGTFRSSRLSRPPRAGRHPSG